jgi:dTDP-4-dehydrorhamnose reductase
VRKKLLITGGSGLLATNWALALKDEYEITLILHSREISIRGIKTAFYSLDSVSECLNFLNKYKPDLVIHTVGLTNIEDCESNPELAYKINSELAKNISISCNQKKTKLVHISTDHLFSGESSLIKENALPSPVNVYAQTKLLAEELVQEHCNDALIIRSNFFGWGTSYRHSFSDFILNKLKKNEQVDLFNDVFYSPIIIEQLCKKVHALVGINTYGIYNIGGGERLSKFEFGVKLAYGFDLNVDLINSISIKEKSDLVSRPRDMSLSNQKLDTILNCQIPGIDKQIQILKMQQNLKFKTHHSN